MIYRDNQQKLISTHVKALTTKWGGYSLNEKNLKQDGGENNEESIHYIFCSFADFFIYLL